MPLLDQVPAGARDDAPVASGAIVVPLVPDDQGSGAETDVAAVEAAAVERGNRLPLTIDVQNSAGRVIGVISFGDMRFLSSRQGSRGLAENDRYPVRNPVQQYPSEQRYYTKKSRRFTTAALAFGNQ